MSKNDLAATRRHMRELHARVNELESEREHLHELVHELMDIAFVLDEHLAPGEFDDDDAPEPLPVIPLAN